MALTARRAAVLMALLVSAVPAVARVIPPAVLPGLGPDAARTVVDAEQPPWRGVVRVQTEVGSRCTGALVGARLVLTAAHCLFGRGTGQLLRPGSVHVLTGYDHGNYAGHARAIAIQIGPGFATGPDGQALSTSPPNADWALLTLDTRLGTPDRVLALQRQLPPPGTAAMLGGYEQDRAQIIVADLACVVIGAVRTADGSVLLRHSCAATRGASGAPLLTRANGGGWVIVGVASAAQIGASGGLAVPVAAVPAAALTALRDRHLASSRLTRSQCQ